MEMMMMVPTRYKDKHINHIDRIKQKPTQSKIKKDKTNDNA